MPASEQVRVGSLFTGGGGLDMAVTAIQPDAEVAWCSEINPHASRLLAARYPDVPNLGDITAIDWTTVEPVDVLVGGFPCQDISHAGKRAGITEESRSGLWFHFRDAIRTLRPRLVLVENVAAITAAGQGLDVVLGSLAEIGFDAQWGCLRASDVGAPHRRDRWFAVAHVADADLSGLEGRDAGGVRRGGAERPVGQGDPRPGLTLLPTPAVNDMGEGKTLEWWDEWTAAQREKHGNGNGHGKSLAIEAQRLLPTPAAADSGRGIEERRHLRTSTGPDLLTAIATRRWGDYTEAIERWESILGRPAPAPVDERSRLAPTFVEWMMGWPEGHVDVDGLNRNQMLKILGNGVVPQQAAVAFNLLVERVVADVC